MSKQEKAVPPSNIVEAIRAKRERRGSTLTEIAELEASLIADIDAFDLDAAERRAKREYLANSEVEMGDPLLVFPDIAPVNPIIRDPAQPTTSPTTANTQQPLALSTERSGHLLDELRLQAENRQREINSALAERNAINESIDQALKHLFFYLHELVQQLNIIKPGIPRQYPLTEQVVLDRLVWQEGFADYRTQSQSAGALVELTTFSYRLTSPIALKVERDGPAVERFRSALFDFALPFTCKEFKNTYQYVERAEFEIRSEISVSARWRADFEKGLIFLETRNLERLGSVVHSLRPQFVDQGLLDNFGYLVLGQPNQFRELAKRQ